MDIFLGILILVLGAAIASMGLRIWFWMLPVLGFMIGFFVGAIAVTGLFGDGMLSTLLGWIAGIIVGIAFMLVSWLWWYTGVIIAASAAGALIGSALLASFGADNRWTLLIAACIGAALFAFVALALKLPVYTVILNTGIAGGIAVVSGMLLIIDRVDVPQLGSGNAVAIIEDSLGWWLLWVLVAAVGIIIQLRTVVIVALPTERYVPTRNAIRS